MKTFLALYMGSPPANPGAAPQMSDETRSAGMAAWGDWMARNAAHIVDGGGPLGVTKKTSAEGVSDIHNRVTGYVVLRAESQQAAAELFQGHPHFTIFPGDSVEIMEILPIPGS